MKHKHTIGIIKPWAFSVVRESDIEKPTKAELIAMVNRPEWELTDDDIGLLMTVSPTVVFNFDVREQ